jgi:hypothetical protein
MAQLHFYVPDDVDAEIRKIAKAAKLPVSRYLAELVKRETQSSQWPKDYFEKVLGSWQGEPLVREDQGEYEERLELE